MSGKNVSPRKLPEPARSPRREATIACGAILVSLAAALTACAHITAPPELPASTPAFSALEARVASGEFGNVHSILVYHAGAPIEERYFSGADARRLVSLGNVAFTADELHDCMSVTKTVVALLVGIALQEGKIASLDAPVLDSFPELSDLRTPAGLRLRLPHLLTMTSGIAWDEVDPPYEDARNMERMMDAAPDRYRYVLEQPVAHDPGEKWNYSGGDVALTAAIVERGVGEKIDAYAARELFAPLGIAQFEWVKDRTGTPLAASGLRLTPRGIARIGLLIAQHGQWSGRQIVPRAWIDAMTSPQITVGGPMRYGYFTWLSVILAKGAPPAPYAAGFGYGGQMLVVFPEEDLIVVSTAGNYGDPRFNKWAMALIGAAHAAAAD